MSEIFADTWIEEHIKRDKLRSETDNKEMVEREFKPTSVAKTIDEISKARVTAMPNVIGAWSRSGFEIGQGDRDVVTLVDALKQR